MDFVISTDYCYEYAEKIRIKAKENKTELEAV